MNLGYHRVSDLASLSAGLSDHAGIAGKSFCDRSRRRASSLKPNPRLDAMVRLSPRRPGKVECVGCLQEPGIGAAAVEADVEFARDAEERTVIENVEVPSCGRKRPRIDQAPVDRFRPSALPVTLRILSAPEPREHKPEILDRLEHGDGIFRLRLSRICRLARVVTWA